MRIVPGIVKSPPDPRDWQFAKVVKSVSLPRKYRLPQLPAVKDQLDRGTCGGFALAGALETNELLENNNYTTLSPLAAYLETRVLDASLIHPDSDGVTLRSLAQTAIDYGSPWELDYPYNTKFANTERPPALLKGRAYRYRSVGYARCANLQDIKQAIYQRRPVLVGVYLLSSIYNAVNGVVPNAEGSLLGGHAMYGVAYDDDRQLIGFRNSWGLGHNIVDADGITWFPHSYIELVMDIGLPMLLDAYALVDFIPDTALTLPATITVDNRPVFFLVDGKPVEMKYAPAFIAKELGRTYVGLRDMGELLGATVGYDEKTNTVILTKR